MRIAALLASASLLLSGGQIRTALHVFTPWDGSIPARGITIDATVRGSCTHGSERLTRFDVWHCSGGGQTHDPCFANTRAGVGAHVLCMQSPWEGATAIELIRPLPLDLANPERYPTRVPPWAIVTATNERCVLVTSSLGRIRGLPISYVCAGAALLLGFPKRGRTWTQAYAASSAAKAYREVALGSVWW